MLRPDDAALRAAYAVTELGFAAAGTASGRAARPSATSPRGRSATSLRARAPARGPDRDGGRRGPGRGPARGRLAPAVRRRGRGDRDRDAAGRAPARDRPRRHRAARRGRAPSAAPRSCSSPPRTTRSRACTSASVSAGSAPPASGAPRMTAAEAARRGWGRCHARRGRPGARARGRADDRVLGDPRPPGRRAPGDRRVLPLPLRAAAARPARLARGPPLRAARRGPAAARAGRRRCSSPPT